MHYHTQPPSALFITQASTNVSLTLAVSGPEEPDVQNQGERPRDIRQRGSPLFQDALQLRLSLHSQLVADSQDNEC